MEVEIHSHGHMTRLSKDKRKASIDSAVASAMAVNRASAGAGGSIYESDDRAEGLLVV